MRESLSSEIFGGVSSTFVRHSLKWPYNNALLFAGFGSQWTIATRARNLFRTGFAEDNREIQGSIVYNGIST